MTEPSLVWDPYNRGRSKRLRWYKMGCIIDCFCSVIFAVVSLIAQHNHGNGLLTLIQSLSVCSRYGLCSASWLVSRRCIWSTRFLEFQTVIAYFCKDQVGKTSWRSFWGRENIWHRMLFHFLVYKAHCRNVV